MAAIGKILAIAGGLLLSVGLGVGGTLAGTALLTKHSGATQVAAKQPPAPKPIYFATLPDLVVSIAPAQGQAATSFVQFGVQFSTYDQNALAVFDQLQPIIKADIISLLMNETGTDLQDPRTRIDLAKSCLDLSNTILSNKAGYTPAAPFNAAYITNLVVQD